MTDVSTGMCFKEFVGDPHPTCPVRISGYAHVAVVVTHETAALHFFAKFGFVEKRRYANIIALMNPNTKEKFEIHVILQPGSGGYAGAYGHDTGINVLMDVDDKYPGHTHIAFNVPSLPATRQYLSLCTVHITGDRGKVACFVRDPDRNVLELIGPLVGGAEGLTGYNSVDEEAEAKTQVVSANDVIASVNHVGIRVSDVNSSAQWYSNRLGFGEQVMWYEPDSVNAKANFRPWIVLNQAEVEINFLLNSTKTASNASNVLLQDPVSGLCPGFIYVAFYVDNLQESVQFYKDQGVTVLEDDVAINGFGLAERICPVGSEGLASVFIQDPDGNFIRLVGKEGAAKKATKEA